MNIITMQNEEMNPTLIKKVELLVNQNHTVSEAVKEVCKGDICPLLFRRMLQEGVVNFMFEKKDSSLRLAYGTINEDIIKQFWTPVPGTKTKPDEPCEVTGIQKFFDIEKKAWRCLIFNKLQIINFEYGE